MFTIAYHVFRPETNPLDMFADYILAGDGVYEVMECVGIRVPVPLVSCEVRGLPPLFSWLQGGDMIHNDPELQTMAELADFGLSYHILTEDHPSLPAVDPRRVYQYVLAREGLFLLAGCTGLEVVMPISPLTALPGLASITPTIRPSYPPVDEHLVLEMLEHAQAARDTMGNPIERLFYFLWEGRWRLHEPEQDPSREHVRAKQVTPEFLAAFSEGHSHHGFAAYFSDGDNIAEVRDGGFRVFFVLGRIFSQPEMRVRICVHGYEWEVPAAYFFALPDSIADCVAREWGDKA
jgi:hypothetical protein